MTEYESSMTEERLSKSILDYHPWGRRDIGRTC
jgi:hypothetical protein